MASDFPSVHLAAPKVYVRYQRPVLAVGGVEQLDGIFPGRRDDSFEPGLCKGIQKDALNEFVLFGDEYNRYIFQRRHSPLLE
jgi:hypothetical protein